MRRGLLSLAAIAAVAAVPSDSATRLPPRAEPMVDIPKAALGNGSRCRPSNKGGYESSAAKKRRRKLARHSQRRNRT